MKTFYVPDLSDKRVLYAVDRLTQLGYKHVDRLDTANFLLLGVNPNKAYLTDSVPIFAGNISGNNIFDYTKEEAFATKNAYLTAEATVAKMITDFDTSIIGTKVLICGYGRIAKALHYYLSPFTCHITICARDEVQRCNAVMHGANSININELSFSSNYDFIINTVPHPIFNKNELSAINNDCIILDLASFPGGVDKHIAKAQGKTLIEARGLPALYSPKSAGYVVADTIHSMISEGRVRV
ncbi:MAG: NAD(P)-dependent oxidoreductase [Eubacterium sp.]